MYHSSCKYNMNIRVGMWLKYSWIKFVDTLLFTVCVTCIQTSILKSKFSVQKDQDPEVGDLMLEQWGEFKWMDELYFMQFTSVSWYKQMTTNTVHGMNNIKFTYRFDCTTMPVEMLEYSRQAFLVDNSERPLRVTTLSVKLKTSWSFVKYEHIERGTRF